MSTTVDVYPLRKVQLGKESTAGTPVATTLIWRGSAIRPRNENTRHRANENVGLSVATMRQYVSRKFASIDFPTTEMTAEMLSVLFDSGIRKASPVQDGPGSGYVRTWATPVDAATLPAVTDLQTRTIQGGANLLVERVPYCFATEFELAGKVEEAWMFNSKWVGRESTSTTFTAGLSTIPVSEFMFNNTKVYLDAATGGTIGTTLLDGVLIDASIKQTTGWGPRFAANGQLTFVEAEFTAPKTTISMTLLMKAQTISKKVEWDANTPYLLRFLNEGRSLTTAGTFSKVSAIFDFAGLFTNWDDSSANAEGAYVVKATFDCGYDTMANVYANYKTVCELSVLP